MVAVFGILYKPSLKISPTINLNPIHSESFACTTNPPHSKTFNITLLYRSPSSSTSLFLNNWRFQHSNHIKTSQSDALKEIVKFSNLVLHNTYPTHEAGNTFDLIISQSSSKIIQSHSQGPLFSDHYTIFITINSSKPHRPYIKKSFRKYDTISHEKFSYDFKLLPRTSLMN